jgi:hypothetical protein
MWVVPRELALSLLLLSTVPFGGAAMGGLLLSSFIPERKEIKKEE